MGFSVVRWYMVGLGEFFVMEFDLRTIKFIASLSFLFSLSLSTMHVVCE